MRRCTWLSGIVAVALARSLLSATGDVAVPPTGLTWFERDIQNLCRYPHRLSGSEAGREASTYIRTRLEQMGVETFVLDMPVWQMVEGCCRLTVDSVTVDLLPVAPNALVPPTTSSEGIMGPMIYVGAGEMHEYGSRTPKGAIVAMEYDSRSNWKRAFSMGARAVVFLGSARSTCAEPKKIGAPANIVRVYVPGEAQALLDFRRDYDSVRLVSHVGWEKRAGTNVLGFLPGTDATFSDIRTQPEMVVLSAAFDTYGEVPFLSPGARGAGNVAALLDAASYLSKNRPRRDILFAFLDNRARYHQGARELYCALMMPEDTRTKWQAAHEEEREFTEKMYDIVANRKDPLSADPGLGKAVMLRLRNIARYMSADKKVLLSQVRIRQIHSQAKDDPKLAEEKVRLERHIARLDSTRRFLADGELDGIDPVLYENLLGRAEGESKQRLDELVFSIRTDRQQNKLLERFGDRWIVLHVTYNFSDAGPLWGPVLGDDTRQGFETGNPNADNVGYYNRVLKALRDALGRVPQQLSVSKEMLTDPLLGRQFIPGVFAVDGAIAGTFGIYNLAFMTCHDKRSRDGHPGDAPGNLQADVLLHQAREATTLMREVADGDDISLQRVFSDNSKWSLPGFHDMKNTGCYAGLLKTQSIDEDRPATDAVLAVWPTAGWNNWLAIAAAKSVLDFERMAIELVDANGRFKITGVRNDIFKPDNVVLCGVVFDSLGGAVAVSTGESMLGEWRVNLFPCRGYVLGSPMMSSTMPTAQAFVMGANTNAQLRPDRSLCCTVEGFTLFYLHTSEATERLKIFQQDGPVMLGGFEKSPYGSGVEITTLTSFPEVDDVTASSFWKLNETRLGILRERNITDVDLEILHGRSRRLLDKAAKTDDVIVKKSTLAQSAFLSQRVYGPLRQTMDDLIKAIVILLLLAIPFAFSMERLIVCATNVYMRILGFGVAFAITFVLLYLMHPGFAIANTPIMVFLAFTIILLSSLVIGIMVRKFKTELMVLQGRSNKLHDVEISRMGTLMVAVNLGMSTMRRRPIRTLLTAITSVMLTFTILCFASFGSKLGVRSMYVGPIDRDVNATFLIRDVSYGAMNSGLPDFLHGMAGDKGLLAGHWWLANTGKERRTANVARLDNGQAACFDAVLGLPPQELELWPKLELALGEGSVQQKVEALRNRGVYLPAIARKQLNLSLGDTLAINGEVCYFAGSIDAVALQRLKHLDGLAVIPVDFQDISYAQAQTNQQESVGSDMVQKDFARLGPHQIIVGSDDLIRRIGGDLRMVSVYAGHDLNVARAGETLTQLSGLPVWTRTPEGIERLTFTQIVGVSGGLALFVPLLLGGLIIFGTLLGSITDRQREIYTLSALGLGPAHVGFLFVAEAAVYAVVGGMGGQVLSQIVAVIASFLADKGIVAEASINFSSTHSLFAIGVVMLTVMASAVYPAIKASKSANPGVQRSWKMPASDGDELSMVFPFTVSAYDITGVVSFLGEHFERHDDAGLGTFAAQDVKIARQVDGHLQLSAHLSLAPFDLGITEDFYLTAVPSEIPGVDEVVIKAVRKSGTVADWNRANRTFIQDLRKQFLMWRTLSAEHIEFYRMNTLKVLGEGDESETKQNGSSEENE